MGDSNSQTFASGLFLTRRLSKSLAFCEFASVNFEPCKSVRSGMLANFGQIIGCKTGMFKQCENKIDWHWIVLPWWGFWNFCGVRNFIFETIAIFELHRMDESLVNFEHYTQKSTFWVLLHVAEPIILLAFVFGKDIIQVLFNLSFYVITHILESSKIWFKHWEKVIWTSKKQTRLLMIEIIYCRNMRYKRSSKAVFFLCFWNDFFNRTF